MATRLIGSSTQGNRGLAGSDEAGTISQTRSSQCIPSTRTATRNNNRDCRLLSRNSSTKNGRKKWKRARRQCDPLPAAARPAQVPGDLLRQVAAPDDQVLGERHVRPEHGEGQHQVAQVVQPVGGRRLGHRPAAGQQDHDGDHHRQGRQRLAHAHQGAVDRRGPVRLQRHHPVDRRERAGQEQEGQSGPADPLEPAGSGPWSFRRS